jgi:glycine cleavage system transcriptional repressor
MSNQSTETPRGRAVLVAFGPDRPGLLDEISAFLMERGGKIEEIRVAELGGHFAFLARAVGPQSALEKIKSELSTLAGGSHIHAEMHPYHDAGGTRDDAFPFRFTATGKGQATTMQRISHLMRVLNINIEDVKTRILAPAPQGQPAPFELELRLSVPRQTPVSMLRDYLAHLCGEMHVEWQLNPA